MPLPKRSLNRLASRLAERRAQEFGIEATVFPADSRSFKVRYLPGSVTKRDSLEDGGREKLKFAEGRIPKADLPRNVELEPGWYLKIGDHEEAQKDGSKINSSGNKMRIEDVIEHPLDPEIRIRMIEAYS